VAFEEAIQEFFLETAGILGVPKSVAAIYAIVFASQCPIGYSEISQRLDLSAGSISQGLRVLRDVGAIKAVGDISERRERFIPDLELRRMMRLYLEQRVEKQLRAGRSRLQAITKMAPTTKGGLAGVLPERLRALRTWHDKSRALLPVVRVFLHLT
jgi:DNA-binding transcriptional regulator GbsR (MarR family)